MRRLLFATAALALSSMTASAADLPVLPQPQPYVEQPQPQPYVEHQYYPQPQAYYATPMRHQFIPTTMRHHLIPGLSSTAGHSCMADRPSMAAGPSSGIPITTGEVGA